MCNRGCVGKDIANQALIINIGIILWACNIEKAVDDAGCPITPSSMDFIDNNLEAYAHSPSALPLSLDLITVLFSRIKSFRCAIRARNAHVEHVLEAAVMEF